MAWGGLGWIKRSGVERHSAPACLHKIMIAFSSDCESNLDLLSPSKCPSTATSLAASLAMMDEPFRALTKLVFPRTRNGLESPQHSREVSHQTHRKGFQHQTWNNCAKPINLMRNAHIVVPTLAIPTIVAGDNLLRQHAFAHLHTKPSQQTIPHLHTSTSKLVVILERQRSYTKQTKQSGHRNPQNVQQMGRMTTTQTFIPLASIPGPSNAISPTNSCPGIIGGWTYGWPRWPPGAQKWGAPL